MIADLGQKILYCKNVLMCLDFAVRHVEGDEYFMFEIFARVKRKGIEYSAWHLTRYFHIQYSSSLLLYSLFILIFMKTIKYHIFYFEYFILEIVEIFLLDNSY